MDLTQLQKHIRVDPDGYRSEFLHQFRHYEATLEIFKTHPEEPSKDFARLVRFVASVADAFPKETASFVSDLMELLTANRDVLDKSLRMAMVQSLMQLRRKGHLEMMSLLLLLFPLFGCKDKSLRHMLFSFIITDIKTAERKQGCRMMRQMKGFLLNTLKDSDEMIAKKALAILTDLWRRQVWQDAHTANVIASAVHHPNNTVMYACVKFFLGYDLKEGEEDEDEDDRIRQETQLCTGDIYRAQKKGTKSSKKRKIRKLKRVRLGMIRQAKREHEPLKEPFAAIQLLQDPYSIAETLFTRARTSQLTSQTRLGIIKLLSRMISVHRLVMLNFYPYLQKYLFPKGRDILVILAALVEGCHEMIPPDAMVPVMRQVVDGFVHDHARPEVITLGLKTVREMCSRAPLIMNEALLSDLVLYKKFKDTEVRAAAKGLVSLFRDIAPHLLPKRERGRGTELDVQSLTFGQQHAYDRLEGADMLQREKQRQIPSSEDTTTEDSSESSEAISSESEDGASTEEMEREGCHSSDGTADDGRNVETDGDGNDTDTHDPKIGDAFDGDAESCRSIRERERPHSDEVSIKALKKQLAMLKQRKHQRQSSDDEDVVPSVPVLRQLDQEEEGGNTIPLNDDDRSSLHLQKRYQRQHVPDMPSEMPIEMVEILSDEDFQRLRDLKRDVAIRKQLRRFGIASDVAVSDRLMQAAEADADILLDRHHHRTHQNESSIDPNSLAGKKRTKADKEERMLSILRGRDEIPYQSRARNKKQKTGGLSNKEKIKRKSLPLKGRIAQGHNRRKRNSMKKKQKNFKGHVKH